MKKQTEIYFTKISKEHSNDLTTIVRETITMDIVPVKKFTSTDLWNIQRRSKSRINSRQLA